MDEIDYEILKHLQQNARISMKNLAALVSLTPPAVAERVKKLEENNVIQGYTTIINEKKLKKNVKAIINITISPEKRNTFIEYARKIENILYAYHVTGAFSICIIAVFKDISELEETVKKLQRFGKTQTLVIMATLIAYRGMENFF